MGSLQQLDVNAFFAVNRGLAHPVLDTVMTLLSSPWVWWACGAMLIGWAFVKKDTTLRNLCLVIAVSVSLSDQVCFQILKPMLARERPCRELPDVRLASDHCGGNYGLPSNHASNAMAAAIPLCLTRRRRWTLPILATACAVGFSRIYLGVHYPGDVLAGFLTGALIGYAIVRGAMHFKWIAAKPRRDR